MSLNITVTNTEATKVKTACLVLLIGNQRQLGGQAAKVDQACGGIISEVLKQGDLPEKPGSTLTLHHLPQINASRVLLISAGDEAITASRFDKIAAAQASALTAMNIKDATSCLLEAEVSDQVSSDNAQTISRAMVVSMYRFELHKSTKSKPLTIKKLSLYSENKKDNKAFAIGVSRGIAVANGLQTARDLGNMAANVCTPTYLADYARKLKKSHPSLKVAVLGEAQMSKLKMGALLSVSAGSEEEAKLICMEHRGGKNSDKPVVLVGKGITFDTGGISIKPSAGMDEMKFDMCGAASVFGVMRAVAELELPVNVIGVVAAAENMPGGKATKPGDIVTSMSGQTVEVLNTDAEGRLVLCDALTYINKYKPDVVIDIATLTGAVIIALGHHTTGMMSNDDDLASELFEAGLQADDKCWRLPIWEEYQRQLTSNFADIPNIGGRPAGSITAGCFLSRFTKEYRWAHLDIAGVAWKQGAAKGATGRPVPMLMEFLLNRSASK